MMPKFPTYNFEWVEDTSQFNEVFIKNYDEKREVGYILEVDVKCPEKLCKLHGDLPFLPERKKIEKIEKIVTNLQCKNEYVVHIKSLKQALNQGLILKKFHRAIGFIKMTHLTMNKPIYLGLLILHLMKTALHEFWYDYIKRTKILQKTSKQDLTLQIMKKIDSYL